MGSQRSVEQILAQLQAQVVHHTERQAFHARQEAFHRDQAAAHGAELAAAAERLAAFGAAAEAAGEFLERSAGVAVQPDKEADEDFGKGRKLSRRIARVLEGKTPDEVFGPTAVTDEINRRWGSKLRRKADPRNVAATLRRWAIAGRIHRGTAGRAYHESLYVKQKPAATPQQ